jgi:VWFA-related protein
MLLSSARAQEGVTGDNPILPRPKKESTEDPKKAIPQIRVTSTLVTAPVTVLDSKGNFVYDLGEEDFKIFDNGVPQRLERFEMEQHPLAVVMVVEANQRVGPLLEEVRPLAPLFSDLMLGPQGKVAVVTYGERVRLALDFTSDGERLEATLRDLKARGDSTRLNDALARAIALLEVRPREERRIVVAFSDAVDRNSETTKEDIVQRAANAEVTIYGLGINPAKELLAREPQAPPPNPLDTNVARPTPPNMPRTPTLSESVYGTPVPGVPILLATGELIHSALASNLLEFYAGYTGGVFYSHWSSKALQPELSRIAAEINSQYELAYVPDTLSQTGFHRIEVQVRRRGVKVRTRAGYFYQPRNP